MTATTTRPRPVKTAGPRPYVRVRTDALAAVVDASGWSHAELALKARLRSPATISNLTSGYRRTCAPATAKALAKALKVPGHRLFEVIT